MSGSASAVVMTGDENSDVTKSLKDLLSENSLETYISELINQGYDCLEYLETR